MRNRVATSAFLSCLCVAATQAAAQGASGSITGTAVDSQKGALAGSTVVAANESTGLSRTLVTDERGDFAFQGLPPGTYSLELTLPGFKTYRRTNLNLSASDVLGLGDIELALGELTEAVTVETRGAYVETGNSAHSGLITANQIEMLSVKGRDLTSLLRLLPGVSYIDDPDSMGGTFGVDLPNIGGQRYKYNAISVDGAPGNELSGNNKLVAVMNLDAISEVKVLLNNYQAEHPGSGGANIQIVGKTGGSKYRGSMYYYGRRDTFNANTFFNTINGLPRPEYKYDTYGFSFGGPVQLPGKWKSKKLFFYGTVELAPTSLPSGTEQHNYPTEAERSGDFSRSVNNTGQPVVIRNPRTGQQYEYQGRLNVIPPNEVNLSLQALMKLMPLPNDALNSDTNYGYNLQLQQVRKTRRVNPTLRLDYRPSGKDSISLALRFWENSQEGYNITGGPGGGGRWLYQTSYPFRSDGFTLAHTRIFSSKTLNEVSFSFRQDQEAFIPIADWQSRITRKGVGYTIPQIHPELNPSDIIPQITAAGTGFSGMPSIDIPDRTPQYAKDAVLFAKDTFTHTAGTHTWKGGALWEYRRNNEADGGTWMGEFNFNVNSANTLTNTGHPWANWLTGNFNSYAESTGKLGTRNRQHAFEWFVQDTWKLNRRLTLDLGMRFLWYQQWWNAEGRATAFVPERWDPARAPRLYYPATVGGRRVALDRATGQVADQNLIGLYVPGTGDPANGMLLASDPSAPRGFRKQRPPHPEPRVGVTWAPFASGKTAVRASFGLFHHYKVGGGAQGNLRGAPLQYTPTIFYNSVDVLYTGNAQGFFGPGGTIRGLEYDAKTPSTYNWQVGLQQDIGFGTVVGVSYVGNVGRHLEMGRNINEIPDGSRFIGPYPTDPAGLRYRPENADPTSTATPQGPLADNFLRPYTGHGNIDWRENWGTSSYNALQVQVNRRFTRGLQVGIAYTWSRAMGYADGDAGDGGAAITGYTDNDVTFTRQRPLRQWSYAPLEFDQTHNLIVNYTWALPHWDALRRNVVTKLLLDNWELSGTNAFVSGRWAPVLVSTTGTPDAGQITGGQAGVRPNVVGQAIPDQQTELRWFDPFAFARPQRGQFGDAPRQVFRRPGVNNWDLALFKRFPLSKNRSVELRIEGFNVLNHANFSRVNNTAQFDPFGNLVNCRECVARSTTTGAPVIDAATGQPSQTRLGNRLGQNVGEVDQARPMRIMQAALRLRF